jgi:hypothetical protein
MRPPVTEKTRALVVVALLPSTPSVMRPGAAALADEHRIAFSAG